jgi:hypothetical protein
MQGEEEEGVVRECVEDGRGQRANVSWCCHVGGATSGWVGDPGESPESVQKG